MALVASNNSSTPINLLTTCCYCGFHFIQRLCVKKACCLHNACASFPLERRCSGRIRAKFKRRCCCTSSILLNCSRSWSIKVILLISIHQTCLSLSFTSSSSKASGSKSSPIHSLYIACSECLGSLIASRKLS